MAKEIGPNWHGMLTVENIEQVADAIRKLLTGKKYTFVACNEMDDFTPKVRTGQQLKPGNSGDPINVYHDDNGSRFAGFNVGDSYGVWSCSTNLQTDVYDPEFKNPYIVFNYHEVTITHRAGSGNKIHWVCAVERE